MGKVWKEEEDALILDFVLKNGKHWDMIASLLPHRTTSQISAHWEKCLDPSLVKGPFTPQEDDIVIQFVKEHGPQNWPLIKKFLPARSPKQCRERWYNHLSPNVSKKEWSAEEDNFIFLAVMQFGQKWSNIAKLIPGRTDNSIKNRFNSSIVKRIYYDPSTGKPTLKEHPKNNKKQEQKTFSIQLPNTSNDHQFPITQSPPYIPPSQINDCSTFQINVFSSDPQKSPISEQKKAPFVLPILNSNSTTENPKCNLHHSTVCNDTNSITNSLWQSSSELKAEPGFSLTDFASSLYNSSSEITDTSNEIKPEPGFFSSFESSFEMQFPAETFLTSPFDDEMIEFSKI